MPTLDWLNRLVCERWAQHTEQCFAMVEQRRNGLDVLAQIRHAAR